MIMVAIKFITLILCVFVGYFLGYVFTETKLRLAQWKIFQTKPFLCRPCLSFHIAWVTSTFISLLLGDLIMLLFGILFARGLWVGLKIDEKERTITLDEYDTITDINKTNEDGNSNLD